MASVTILLVFLSILVVSSIDASRNLYAREDQNASELTCICGLDIAMLEKIEAIVKASNPVCASDKKPDDEADNDEADNEEDETSSSSPSSPSTTSKPSPTTSQNSDSSEAEPILSPEASTAFEDMFEEIQGNGSTGADHSSNSTDKESGKSPKTAEGDNSSNNSGGFLSGLPNTVVSLASDLVGKFNKTNQVDNQKLESAVQVTVPQLVANVFDDIKNLSQSAGSTDGQKGGNQIQQLESIDGTSIDVVGQSSSEVIKEGAKLFYAWIEHQLESLHLTANTADYIRRTAVKLFVSIAKEYVKVMGRVNGEVNNNVRRGIQMALKNTQILVSFIMKNYLQLSGVIIQMIGENVSRIGKIIDSTGGTISRISLNPFTIASNVFESLPNPTSYAKYLRNFGQQLIGGVTNATNNSQTVTNNAPIQSGGITSMIPFTNVMKGTVGTVTKTLGSWLGR